MERRIKLYDAVNQETVDVIVQPGVLVCDVIKIDEVNYGLRTHFGTDAEFVLDTVEGRVAEEYFLERIADLLTYRECIPF